MVQLLKRIQMLQEWLPEWDYEWYPTDGLLQNNGFNYVIHGASGYACTISSDETYMQYRGSSANYKEHVYPNDYQKGVLEAEIYVASNGRMDVHFGNGSYGIGLRLQGSSSYTGFYLGDDTTQKIANAKTATKYKIRLVLNGQVGEIYIGDSLVASNVDTTLLTVCNHPSVLGRGSGTGNVYSRLYSLKMKFNRTE